VIKAICKEHVRCVGQLILESLSYSVEAEARVVVVVVVAQEVFYVSPDLRMSELRKSGSVCTFIYCR
jgi:hypothetical protein